MFVLSTKTPREQVQGLCCETLRLKEVGWEGPQWHQCDVAVCPPGLDMAR